MRSVRGERFPKKLRAHMQVQLDQLCMHSCCIIGEGGLHWPCPTFRVLASDRPDEPLDAKSPTGAWNAALSRINAEIEARSVALGLTYEKFLTYRMA